MKKNDVYIKIVEAANFGNLGFFLGTGFSKAVIGWNIPLALSWKKLLETLCEKNGISWESLDKTCKSYPEIAQSICEQIKEKKSKSLNDIKDEVCKITSWLPNETNREKFQNLLTEIKPQWIITTNYDLVIECLLPYNSRIIPPDEALIISKNLIPIYHLHGIRTKPDSIIFTQDDYIKLFRPGEYRLNKLAFVMKESTVVFIGYGFGDANVQTALDWSKNFYKEIRTNDISTIQIIYKETPSKDVKEIDGVYYLETDSIETTFNEICRIKEQINIAEGHMKEMFETWIQFLTDGKEETINNFINDPNFRQNIIKAINNQFLVEAFLLFLSRVFDRCWKNSEPKNAFWAYRDMAYVTMDIIKIVAYEKMPAIFFSFLASQISKFAYFIADNSFGKSHDGYNFWNNNKNNIPQKIKEELHNYACNTNSYSMIKLFE